MLKIKKRIVINLVLSIITIILVLMLLEIILRIFYPQPLNPTFLPTDSRGTFAEYDEILGWRLKPNAEGVFFSGEYQVYIKNNAQGMRMSKDITLDKSKYRIAFLGDSFVWGFGVNEEDRVSELLEKELNNIEVLNFGVSGYAIDQYYLQLNNTVLNFNPDIIIIGFYANDLYDIGNDVMDGYPKPLFKINENNELELTNVPVPKREISEVKYSTFRKINLYLSHKSHAYVFFKPLFRELYNSINPNKDEVSIYEIREIPILLKDFPREYQEYKKLNDKLYCETSKLLKQKNINLVVVNIPSKLNVFPEILKNKIKGLNINENDLDLNKPATIFNELSSDCDFYFIDLYPYFIDYEDKEKLYYKYDAHLTPLGHEYASEILLKELRNYNLIENGK